MCKLPKKKIMVHNTDGGEQNVNATDSINHRRMHGINYRFYSKVLREPATKTKKRYYKGWKLATTTNSPTLIEVRAFILG